MPAIYRARTDPFVLDSSKLTRLMNVIKEALAPLADPRADSFLLFLSDYRHVDLDALDHVLALDNSTRARVQRLSILCGAGHNTDGSPRNAITLAFEGTNRPRHMIRISVEGESTKWVSNTFSVVEEQVERTFNSSFWARMIADPKAHVIMVALAGLTLGLLTVGIPYLLESQLWKSMWLTSDDLRELSQTPGILLGDGSVLPSELLKRQLVNLAAEQDRSRFQLFQDWRVYVVLLPFFIMAGSLVYLTRLYPPAVFLWGDAEEWYRGIQRRRDILWNVVIGSLLLGFVTNLAVFAFGDLFSSGTS
jgi:hypothetical protein